MAVIELVKNAYDADATRVLVRFRPPLIETGQGAIEVIDNGHGMSLKRIEETWMEPATLHRKRNPRSEELARRVLGEKGIGRFATSRLAEKLEVISRRRDDELETHVLFDWSAFDDDDRYLDEIEAFFWQDEPKEFAPGEAIDLLWRDERPPKGARRGTILRMEGLRQRWAEEDLQDLRVGLARLISPFEYNRGQESFRILLDVPEPYEAMSGLVEPPELLESPQYSLTGDVGADGSYTLGIRLRNQTKVERISGQFTIDGREPNCGPFRIELGAWDRDAASMHRVAAEQGSTVRSIREDLDQAAGLNIYRDGFRVLPYGERRNDWLRLDLRRVQNPTMRLSNNQIVGYVLISADTNPHLRDQSNREGLIENQAYDDLVVLARLMLAELETRRYVARRPTGETASLKGGIFGSFSLTAVRSYARQHHGDDEKLLELLGETANDLARRVEEVQEVIARYRRLATLGQLIDIVLHDGRAPVAKIGNEAHLGLRDIERRSNDDLVPKLGERLETIHTQSDVLAVVFRRIEPFGGRRRGRPRRLAVEAIIADAFAVVETEIAEVGARVALPRGKHVVSVDPAELQEVILNLLQNSLWWLRETPEGKRRIAVQVRRHDNRLEIVFSDSGPGVNEEFADRIFDPYFSTKPSGVGLGLTIAGEIVSEYYAGELELLDRGPLPGATFRVTLRRRI